MSTEVRETIKKNQTERMRCLDRLESWVKGTQYDGMPGWYDDGDIPLLERAPSVVYPIFKTAIESHASLVLGEHRFPTITSRPYDDESDDADQEQETGLNEADSQKLDYFVRQILRQTRLKTVATRLLVDAMSCGTAVAICASRNGKLVVDTTKAKWCRPTFANDGKLTKLEIRYPYKVTEYDAQEPVEKVYLYRRVITDERDTVFRPVEAHQDGSEPVWTVDQTLSVEHNLGFVPAVWYKFFGECHAGEIDGEAIHAHLMDEAHALNVSLSQRNRAARYLGDPQIVETGVDPSHERAPGGRTAMMIVDPAENGVYRSIVNRSLGGGRPASRKGPSVVWSYDSPDTKVQLLTLPGDALDAIDKDAADLRNKIAESLNILFFETDSIDQVTVSGVALGRLLARQTNYCDMVRDDFAHGCLTPLVDMLLRLVATVVGRGAAVSVSGLQGAAPILSQFMTPGGWVSPDLSVVWPPYFEMSAPDEKMVVDLVVAAKNSGAVPTSKLVEKLAEVFNITDIAEAVAELEQDALRQVQLQRESDPRTAGQRPGSPGVPGMQRSADADPSSGRGD